MLRTLGGERRIDGPGRFASARIATPMRQIVSALFVLTFAIVSVSKTHAAAARPLRIAYLFTSGTMASMWMAKESGGFAQEGLDFEKIFISSGLAPPAPLFH